VPFEREHGESETVAVTLAEFAFAFRLQQQGQVREAGHGILPPKSLVEQYVEWGAGQPFLTTDDVCDLHQVIINDVGQMIGGQFVCTLVEHLVIENVALDTHVATDHIVDVYFLSRLYLEAHGVLHAVVDEFLPLLFGQGERVAHLHAGRRVVLEVFHFGALGFQLLRRVEGIVSLAGTDQLVHVFLVDIAALALTVGTMVASKADTLIKLYAEPSERLQDVLLGTGNKTV